jgi:hypothetical protein
VVRAAHGMIFGYVQHIERKELKYVSYRKECIGYMRHLERMALSYKAAGNFLQNW